MKRKSVPSPSSLNKKELQHGLDKCVNQHSQTQSIIDSLITGEYVSLQEQIKRDTKEIYDWYKELPSEVQKAIKLMADKGWYWDREMDLSDLLDAKDDEYTDFDIETGFEEYFENELDRIEKDIISRLKNPERAKIIASVFKSHRNGLYNLTVPTLFTQIDGICIDKVARKHFFMTDKNSKNPEIAAYIEELPKGYLTDAILDAVIKTKTPVNQSTRERGDSFSGLNRHQVLHGAVCDYGTKRNSLKAISLLNYVSIALTGELKYP